MAEFLLELYSEEIPHGLQINAREEIKKNLLKSLEEVNIKCKSAEVYSTPTRLVLLVRDLPNEIKIDAKEIVIDEFVGQSIPILTIYGLLQKNDIDNFLLYTLLSFFLFRLFDILKPYPINKIDEKMKNGFGVILDDIVAGIYSVIILLTIFIFINYV